MADDLRADLEAALGDTDDGVTQDTTVDTSVDTSPTPDAEPPVEGDKVRDALGRFVHKAGDTPAAAPAIAAPDPSAGAPTQAELVAPQADAAPLHQAPTSWGAAVREHWGTLPPAVQEQISQREQQFQQAFRESAPMRNTGEAFIQAIQPFQHAIQAEGVDPITAVSQPDADRHHAALRHARTRRPTTVAKLVKAYGVDINALDGALVGAAAPARRSRGSTPATSRTWCSSSLRPCTKPPSSASRRCRPRWRRRPRPRWSSSRPATQHFGRRARRSWPT